VSLSGLSMKRRLVVSFCLVVGLPELVRGSKRFDVLLNIYFGDEALVEGLKFFM